MWVLFAFGSALFAGLTAILAKCGIRDTDSNVVTALRTVVVLVFSWIMVFLTGSISGITDISFRTMTFLVWSGVATGASWLCYFRALQTGDVDKVTPIDKSSTVLTMVLAAVFLGERISMLKAVCIVLIAAGTYLMIRKSGNPNKKVRDGAAFKENGGEKISVGEKKTGRWMLYAFGSAVFASLTSILGKTGIEGIDSNLGTAIRTVVVLIMAWIVVFVTRKQSAVRQINKKSWLFIVLSGCATGCSWLCYYRALQSGPASVVVPIDKLSILVTISFAYFVFGEKLDKKSAVGLGMIVAGTLLLLV